MIVTMTVVRMVKAPVDQIVDVAAREGLPRVRAARPKVSLGHLTAA
jgi:hypothetical protein